MEESKINLDNMPIWQLTVGELRELLEITSKKQQQEIEDIIETIKAEMIPNHVYGLIGLAQLFGWSKTTASRYKKSGIFDDAITQVGQSIIIDSTKALELAKKANITIKNHEKNSN
jgi:hypothetical protein